MRSAILAVLIRRPGQIAGRRTATRTGRASTAKRRLLRTSRAIPSSAASSYLKFIMAAIERAIAPNAAWYCWHASARQAMLEAVWNEVGAFAHQQIIWV